MHLASLISLLSGVGLCFGAAPGFSASNALTFHTLGKTQSLVIAAADAVALFGVPGLAAKPVTFASGAKGMLTTRIVVGISSDSALTNLRSLPGYVSDERLAFHTRTVTAMFATPEAALLAAEALYGRPGVRFAHPDFKLALEKRSDPAAEPLFATQWNLIKIGAPTAWEKTTGRPEVIIADLDLGFEQSHPDTSGAWLVNTAEVEGNRRDDDGNGLIDDVRGWNFAIDGANLIYGAAPNHGTATSGILGARANGEGIAGLCPDCRVLPVVIDDQVSNAAKGFRYAMSRGASVISDSWGYATGSPETDVVTEAIHEVATSGRGGRGISIIFAMGNAATDNCRGSMPDISSHPDVIAVSSVDDQDRKVGPSGYGACLKLVAPSSETQNHGIPTTDRPAEKGYNTGASATDISDLSYTNTFYGTSAAAPQVAGAFALLYSARPELTKEEALATFLATAAKVSPEDAAYDSVNGFSSKYGYGRVDVGAALAR